MQALNSIVSTTHSECPLDNRIITTASELHEFFIDTNPLPNFLTVNHFLADKYVEILINACQYILWKQYAVWSLSKDGHPLQSGFQDINPDWYYLSIHQRTDEYPKAFQFLEKLMGNQSTLQILEKIIGTNLKCLGKPNILTGWKAGSFLGPHNDSGGDNPVKLVVSYSLTEKWQKIFGGSTDFQWKGQDRMVTTWPKRNQATLFIPSKDSMHWVNPINNKVSEVKRITWTLHYY